MVGETFKLLQSNYFARSLPLAIISASQGIANRLSKTQRLKLVLESASSFHSYKGNIRSSDPNPNFPCNLLTGKIDIQFPTKLWIAFTIRKASSVSIHGYLREYSGPAIKTALPHWLELTVSPEFLTKTKAHHETTHSKHWMWGCGSFRLQTTAHQLFSHTTGCTISSLW